MGWGMLTKPTSCDYNIGVHIGYTIGSGGGICDFRSLKVYTLTVTFYIISTTLCMIENPLVILNSSVPYFYLG